MKKFNNSGKKNNRMNLNWEKKERKKKIAQKS